MWCEWDVLPLNKAGVKLIDCVHKTPQGTEAGFPYIGIPQMKGGHIDFNAGPRVISKEDYLEWTTKAKPQENDVVLSRRCNPGEIAYVSKNTDFALGQNLVLLRADGTKVYPPFLRWVTQGPEWWEQIGKFLNVGAVFDSLRCADIPNFELSIPPLSQQKAIAHILGSLDDKIELNRRMNATLEAMAQALFKSWFVDFDPVIDNALAAGHPIPEPLQERAEARAALGDQRQPLPEVIRQQFPNRFVCNEDMGWVPEGWKIELLKNLATKIGSGATPRGGGKVYVEEGTSLIRSQNVYDSRFVWDGLVRINEEAATQLKGVTVLQHDVLINITGASILRTCVVDPAVLPARVNQHVAIIRAKNQIPPRFIHLHLLQEKTKNLLLGQNAGASREAVTKGHLESVTILVPGEGLLQHFKQLTDPLYEKEEKLSQEARTLAQLRDTLLPKLLSGQLRIPEAEQQVADML